MKHVTIAGTGTGPGALTLEAKAAIERADALIGAKRLIGQFEYLGKPSFAEYMPDPVRTVIEAHSYEHICVLVSGDTGFFSAADGLLRALAGFDVTVLPGISSLSCMFARLGMPWQDAAAISCHGRDGSLVDTVRRHKLTFALTGGNLGELGAKLVDAGYGCLVAHIGANLGLGNEKIIKTTVCALDECAGEKLAVLVIENPDGDARIPFGLADELFVRGDVPMTKSEVRAVTMSKLRLAPDAVCLDLGAGTGSVTVEMALAAYRGRVYAIDKNESAIELIRTNCRAFHIGNVIPMLGAAPGALDALPPLDAVFVGGSSGAMSPVFESILSTNPRCRIVINAVTLETLHAATAAFAQHGIEPEIVQLAVTRANLVGKFHMLQAQSPIFILSGGGQ